jgi:energy-coupling factor transport system ATP-binding protein
MGPLVTITGLTFRYFSPSKPVFSAYGLTIPPGSCCAVLGPSGAGKTTLLEILSGSAGAHYRTARCEGSVKIGGTNYSPIPSAVLFPEVGFVLQDPYVQISGIKSTVRSEIEFTLENLGIERGSRIKRVDAILDMLSLTPLADRHPYKLSGGEMQRVALASILVAEPPLLLLDEPANGLDIGSRMVLKNILRSLKGTTTIVLTDYTLAFALDLADRFVVLENGINRFEGTRKEFEGSLHALRELIPVESATTGNHTRVVGENSP